MNFFYKKLLYVMTIGLVMNTACIEAMRRMVTLLTRQARQATPATLEIFKQQGVKYSDGLETGHFMDKKDKNLGSLVLLDKHHFDAEQLDRWCNLMLQNLEKQQLAELLNSNTEPVKMYVRYVSKKMGHGTFADQKIHKGTFIAEYTGVVHTALSQLGMRELRDSSYDCSYAVPIQTSYGSQTKIDAYAVGNETRYMNDGGKNSNIFATAVLGDDGLPHVCFFALRDIEEGEQFLWNYGGGYWIKHSFSGAVLFSCVGIGVFMFFDAMAFGRKIEQKAV